MVVLSATASLPQKVTNRQVSRDVGRLRAEREMHWITITQKDLLVAFPGADKSKVSEVCSTVYGSLIKYWTGLGT